MRNTIPEYLGLIALTMMSKRSRLSAGTPEQRPTKAVRRSDAAGPSPLADDSGGEGAGRDGREDGAAVLSPSDRAMGIASQDNPSLPEHEFNIKLCKHLLSVDSAELEVAQPWLKPPHLKECHGALFGDIAKQIGHVADRIASTDDDPGLQRGVLLCPDSSPGSAMYVTISHIRGLHRSSSTVVI